MPPDNNDQPSGASPFAQKWCETNRSRAWTQVLQERLQSRTESGCRPELSRTPVANKFALTGEAAQPGNSYRLQILAWAHAVVAATRGRHGGRSSPLQRLAQYKNIGPERIFHCEASCNLQPRATYAHLWVNPNVGRQRYRSARTTPAIPATGCNCSTVPA